MVKSEDTLVNQRRPRTNKATETSENASVRLHFLFRLLDRRKDGNGLQGAATKIPGCPLDLTYVSVCISIAQNITPVSEGSQSGWWEEEKERNDKVLQARNTDVVISVCDIDACSHACVASGHVAGPSRALPRPRPDAYASRAALGSTSSSSLSSHFYDH